MEKQTIKEFQKILVEDNVSISELFLNNSYNYYFDKEDLCELAGEIFYQTKIMAHNLITDDKHDTILKDLVFESLEERYEEQ